MTPDMVVQAFGPAAAVVIIALAGTVLYLFRARENDRKESDRAYKEVMDERLKEAKEVNDKLFLPMNEQKELSQRIYDLLLLISRRGKD